ncbi:uncharacterized protein V1510DRAFT_367563 [Dipodascopsis tothii]|uniref:uncharacterized protein n=1 Tax=Dipodascopsis tothii TaxID=44089 RepID=UPI0034CDE8B1
MAAAANRVAEAAKGAAQALAGVGTTATETSEQKKAEEVAHSVAPEKEGDDGKDTSAEATDSKVAASDEDNSKKAGGGTAAQKPKDPTDSHPSPLGEGAAAAIGAKPADNPTDRFAKTKGRGKSNIFLINSPRYHYEVVMPFLYSFSHLEDVNVKLIGSPSGYNRFGVRPLLSEYALPHGLNLVGIDDLANVQLEQPDLIFLVSCPEDTIHIGSYLTKWLENGAHVMCIVHEASRWNLNDADNDKSAYKGQIGYMIPWIKKGQWEIVTLSNHVQKFVREKFPLYFNTGSDVAYPAEIVHPVFTPSNAEVIIPKDEKPFSAIVGKLEPWRRNYDKIFRQYAKLNPPVDLHIVGAGLPLELPSEIEDRIKFDLNLDFPEYFAEVGKAIAVIPSFATREYTESQASSATATSIIVGTPLLVSADILSAYSQIPEDCVWLQESGETEIEAFTRVAKLGRGAWMEKKRKVAAMRQRMSTENMAFFEKRLSEISAAKKSSDSRDSKAIVKPKSSTIG